MSNILKLITPGPWFISPQQKYIRAKGVHGWNIAAIEDQIPYTTFNAKAISKVPEMLDILTRLSEDLNRADYPENSWMGKYNTEINGLLNQLNK